MAKTKSKKKSNKKLQESELVLNEVEELQKVIKTKELPKFWNVFQFLHRFVIYYRGLDYNDTEIVDMIVEWLIASKTDYDVDTLYEFICNVPKKGEEDYYPLRELPTTLVLYEDEINTIKSIKTRPSQQFYFALLLVSKVQQLKGKKDYNYIYYGYLSNIGKFAQLNATRLNQLLVELGYEMKLLSFTLDSSYIEVKVGEGKIAHKIENFDPCNIQMFFTEIFGKFEPQKEIWALDYWNEEEPLKFGSINECGRELGISPSDITRCVAKMWTKRGAISAKGYLFIDATRLEDETDKEFHIRTKSRIMALHLIKPYYSKLKNGKLKLVEPIVIDYGEDVEGLLDSIGEK